MITGWAPFFEVLGREGVADENGWMPISTAPKDGSFVLLYWPTMSITAYPAIGIHHGDEYGWELVTWPDYGEIYPTHWQNLPAPPVQS